MPTDLTGTATSLGIGTYNVDTDSPSGLGFNEAMAQIDALIAARMLAPPSLEDGDVPVWDTTTSSWVASHSHVINAGSLGTGTRDGTKFLRDDNTWQTPTAGDTPGTELDYAIITATVNITGTSEGAATTIITGTSRSYDGTKVRVQFWAPGINTGTGMGVLTFVLLRDTTVLGHHTAWEASTSSTKILPTLVAYDTPDAGSHQYILKAYGDVVTGTPGIPAGPGGSGQLLPAFLRVTKA